MSVLLAFNERSSLVALDVSEQSVEPELPKTVSHMVS